MTTDLTITLGHLKQVATFRPLPAWQGVHDDEPSALFTMRCHLTGATIMARKVTKDSGWFSAYTYRYHPKPFYFSPAAMAMPDDTPVHVFEEWSINANSLHPKDLEWAIDRIKRGGVAK